MRAYLSILSFLKVLEFQICDGSLTNQRVRLVSVVDPSVSSLDSARATTPSLKTNPSSRSSNQRLMVHPNYKSSLEIAIQSGQKPEVEHLIKFPDFKGTTIEPDILEGCSRQGNWLIIKKLYEEGYFKREIFVPGFECGLCTAALIVSFHLADQIESKTPLPSIDIFDSQSLDVAIESLVRKSTDEHVFESEFGIKLVKIAKEAVDQDLRAVVRFWIEGGQIDDIHVKFFVSRVAQSASLKSRLSILKYLLDDSPLKFTDYVDVWMSILKMADEKGLMAVKSAIIHSKNFEIHNSWASADSLKRRPNSSPSKFLIEDQTSSSNESLLQKFDSSYLLLRGGSQFPPLSSQSSHPGLPDEPFMNEENHHPGDHQISNGDPLVFEGLMQNAIDNDIFGEKCVMDSISEESGDSYAT